MLNEEEHEYHPSCRCSHCTRITDEYIDEAIREGKDDE
jgi:hypothetical protein